MGPAKLFTISADRSFADELAAGLLAMCGDDPARLSEMLIMLPTRRACRSLREAFLRVRGGQALLLPRMQPLGDVDEEEMVLTAPAGSASAVDDLLALPPAIGETERLLQLSNLVLAYRRKLAEAHDSLDPIGPEQALLLAQELARFLNQVQTEGLSLDRLEELAPDELAEHWAATVTFLDIIRTAWPAYLDGAGQIDPAARRNLLMTAQARHWRENPPDHPVIAAGTTGSIPATRQLIDVIRTLPQGMVVLPGLDRYLDDDAWDHARTDPSHAQHGLAVLFQSLGIDRTDVADWHCAAEETPRAARTQLLSDTMRPASTTAAWDRIDHLSADAMTGIEWIEAPSPAMEAAIAAQALREVLETPGKTAALITPDRNIARRVASELARWGIEIDDSAGIPLRQTAAGRFFLLLAEAAASNLSPVALLGLLKHPLAAMGKSPATLRRDVRNLERVCLRGPKPGPGTSGLRSAIDGRLAGRNPPSDTAAAQARATLDLLDSRFATLLAAMRPGEAGAVQADFAALLRAHIETAEAVAETDTTPGADRLWQGEDGEELAAFLSDLIPSAHLMGGMSIADYAPSLATLMGSRTVRPRYGKHPRLAILGPLEARLQHADRMILAGLNEGTWPPAPPDDPWMSRAMRREFGLPAHERRIGLAAHDFAQAAGAPEVILIRAAKEGGQQTVPARWLERLATVLERGGLSNLLPAKAPSVRLAWHHALEAKGKTRPVAPPAPCPPVGMRPRFLSATRVETLMRDPYSIYARSILKLEKIDGLEEPPSVADKGTMIHTALDQFVTRYAGPMDDAAVEELIRIGRDAFGTAAMANPAIRAFWWPRFVRIARWFVAEEAKRRETLEQSLTEIRGRIELAATGGPFTLYAEADRIDRLADGTYAILDYKTGGVPKKKDVVALNSPQLVIEAAILRGGGYDGIPAGAGVSQLAYWKLSGADPAGDIVEIDKIDPNDLADEIVERISSLIEAYDREDTPYRPIPRPELAPRYNDYEHLARNREWAKGEGADGMDA
ncbi:MAG: double-strand break repair protein AddB [Alphaproteobacteria bacterium]